MSVVSPRLERAAVYRILWRWHFYAGLMVLPFILILAATGSIYLFKPQIDRWEERAFRDLPTTGSMAPSAQVRAALAARPHARLESYRLPEAAGDAAMVALTDADGPVQMFVSPQAKVIGMLDPASRFTAVLVRIHGTLLAGTPGSWIVETVGCWAIVMILTGLYLWWPRGGGAAGVIWPRLRQGRRVLWRDLHAVSGFWVSGLALVLLVSALPWDGVWGEAFRLARVQTGNLRERPDWKIGAETHAGHHPDRPVPPPGAGNLLALDRIVATTPVARLAGPVLVKPPGAPDRTGPAPGWTLKTEAQNRPRNIVVRYDDQGREVSRKGFADKQPIDQLIAYGIAWHEGQLLGWPNIVAGLFTALALIVMTVSGTVMWWRRRPSGTLGAPPLPEMSARMGGALAILLVLAALLPMLALSLILVAVIERAVLARVPRMRMWLGIPGRNSTATAGRG
ncbi:MAG: hypothetical protein B7Y45_04445 [Sphingomonas sp. 28-66-16]|nr:MAG: hypothetical protein B7Y45_04445 [Sphingomonas sp. 28-66-16]